MNVYYLQTPVAIHIADTLKNKSGFRKLNFIPQEFDYKFNEYFGVLEYVSGGKVMSDNIFGNCSDDYSILVAGTGDEHTASYFYGKSLGCKHDEVMFDAHTDNYHLIKIPDSGHFLYKKRLDMRYNNWPVYLVDCANHLTMGMAFNDNIDKAGVVGSKFNIRELLGNDIEHQIFISCVTRGKTEHCLNEQMNLQTTDSIQPFLNGANPMHVSVDLDVLANYPALPHYMVGDKSWSYLEGSLFGIFRNRDVRRLSICGKGSARDDSGIKEYADLFEIYMDQFGCNQR